MRRAHVMVAGVLLSAAMGCDRMWGPDPRVARQRAMQVTADESQRMLGGECSVIGGPGTTPCPNLLPARWDTLTNSNLDTLVQRLQLLLPSGGQVVRNRVASSDCANGPAPAADSVPVSYQVPAAAMKLFPTTGTNGRELVVGVMIDQSTTKPCWSQKYSVTNKLQGGSRLMTIITVATDSGGKVSNVDRTVGVWRSWSIIVKNPQQPQQRKSVMNTGSGAYVSCGHQHYQADTTVTHAFISCGTIARLMQKARELSPKREESAVTAEFNRLLRDYRDGKAPAGMTFLGGSEPGWARCGNLGCCTAA